MSHLTRNDGISLDIQLALQAETSEPLPTEENGMESAMRALCNVLQSPYMYYIGITQKECIWKFPCHVCMCQCHWHDAILECWLIRSISWHLCQLALGLSHTIQTVLTSQGHTIDLNMLTYQGKYCIMMWKSLFVFMCCNNILGAKTSFRQKMSLADAILPSKWRASDKLPPFAFETSGFWVCKGL